jgi:uncharacterized membrane protein
MDIYLIAKFIHILGACLLFGTGLGIAFFMLMAHRSGDPELIAHTARSVIVADLAFTASAVIVQPLSGIVLADTLHLPLTESWIAASLALYVFVGLCWLPVVWIQIRLRVLTEKAAHTASPLPQAYHRLFRVWFALGWPAFFGVVAIIALMLVKPALW